jgi:transcriptional regulator GlxA family with amidase domain
MMPEFDVYVADDAVVPASGSRDPASAAAAVLPRRPRSTHKAFPRLVPARGGLRPHAIRRVREFVDDHLDQRIDLAAMAAIAGLSTYHFARAFKLTQGDTPHVYVMQRRIERAQDLLVRTDLALSEIAARTGFADQSHLARHFRRRFGIPPSTFRWAPP